MIKLTTKNMLEISKKLKMDVREGKHTNARLVINGILVISTCWSHGKKEIPKGTANKILRHQLLLETQAQAYGLRDCHMNRSSYIQHLTEKKVIQE